MRQKRKGKTMESKKSKEVSMMEMLKVGVHFGHKKSKRHPKMTPYIYTVRNSISIIDLGKTVVKLNEALEFVKDVTSKGGVILFVSTKKQARETVKEAAEKCGMPYVTERWLGGTFTNFKKITGSIKRLEKMVSEKESGELEKKYNKKERLEIDREIKRLERKFGGIKTIKKLPEAVFIVDVKEDMTALTEARSEKVPVIATVDTNVDPTLVNYPIPSNDDAVGAIKLMTNIVADAIIEAKKQ